MKHIIFTLFITCSLGVAIGQTQCNYVHYEGSLEDGTTYIADLTFSNGNVNGYYYYQLHKQVGNADAVIYGDWNTLEGTMQGDNIYMYEWLDGDTGAIIQGKIGRNLEITGNWHSKRQGMGSEFVIKPAFHEETIPFRSYCHMADTGLTRKPDSPKAEINLNLLLPDSKVMPGLASLMNKYILREYAPKEEGRDGPSILKSIRQDFFRQYIEKNKDIHESGFSFNWVKYLNTSIYFNMDGYTVYKVSSYGFTGGAHGITRINYLVFDTKNVIKLTPQDIFIKEHENQLSLLIAGKLKELYEIPADKSLTQGGFFEDTVVPNDNIFLNIKGLGFLYNQYEIAPYSYGQIEVFFTFEELKSLLNPGFRVLNP